MQLLVMYNCTPLVLFGDFATYFRHLWAKSINPSASHPSCHGSIALLMPEEPKICVGAICFTSSGSDGGCWVVLLILFLSRKTKV